MELRLTSRPGFGLQRLAAVNASAAFNRLIGLEARDGEAEFHTPSRAAFAQYAGHLHAGMIAACSTRPAAYEPYERTAQPRRHLESRRRTL